MAEHEKMIEVNHLTKAYGNLRALDDVSFHVRQGEVLGFLGPNGAGKTTTMKILTCFIAPSAGQVKIAGMDISTDSLEIRRQVGYLPESAPLYIDMQVEEYLDFIADVRGMMGPQKRQGIDRVVERCGLTSVSRREIRTLSKGYRQRVGLAQSMIHNPPILILDEPTSGLDPNQIVEIRELIKEIGKERTVILSTHNLSEVQAAAQRVVIVNQGKVVADGRPAELEEDRGGARYDVIIEQTTQDLQKVLDVFRKIDGVREVDAHQGETEGQLEIVVRGVGDKDVRADIFRAAVDQKWVLIGLGRKQVDLESVFQRLTKSSTATESATGR